MTPLRLFTSALAIGGLIAMIQPATAQSAPPPAGAQQQGQDYQEHHPAGNQPPVTSGQEAQAMGMHQKMMADMKATDTKLDALVIKMNSAKGDAKVEAIAELLSAVVQQRRAMRDGMMQMQSQMMGHVMQHMSAGMSPEMQKMMAECPMMKQMGSVK